MPLSLPDLDTRRFDDLVGEMRALIPQIAPDWTNHNPSDPGIALAELFAWVTEVNLYRANRIKPRTIANFIALLSGQSSVVPDSLDPATSEAIEHEVKRATPEIEQVFVSYLESEGTIAASVLISLRAGTVRSEDMVAAAQQRLNVILQSALSANVELLEDAKQRALREFSAPYRAITPADFERQAALASADVGRVSVTIDPRLGGVSVIIVPATGLIPGTSALDLVRNRLAARRLIGTRLTVRAPYYTGVRLSVEIAVKPNTVVEDARAATEAEIREFLDPLVGGPDGTGWPFARPVSIYDLFRVVESIPAVDHVVNIAINDATGISELPIAELPRLDTLAVGTGA